MAGKPRKRPAGRSNGNPAAHGNTATFMERANREVGSVFGTEPKCLQAVALLTLVASHAGIRVSPLPVALAARRSERLVALGRRAQAAWSDETANMDFQGKIADGWEDAGHLVVLQRGSRRIYDPTVQQVGPRLQYPMSPLVLNVAALEPPSGYWEFRGDDLTLRYYPVPDEESWKPKFTAISADYGASGLAAEIARLAQPTSR